MKSLHTYIIYITRTYNIYMANCNPIYKTILCILYVRFNPKQTLCVLIAHKFIYSFYVFKIEVE